MILEGFFALDIFLEVTRFSSEKTLGGDPVPVPVYRIPMVGRAMV